MFDNLTPITDHVSPFSHDAIQESIILRSFADPDGGANRHFARATYRLQWRPLVGLVESPPGRARC